MFKGPFDESIIKRAIDKNLVEIEFVDIRKFGIGKHKIVDDTPYGGGVGMVMKVDVVEQAISETRNKRQETRNKEKVVLLDPRGKKFTQEKAREFSKLDHLILVCGHYEGIDERIMSFIDEAISIGDFVLTGGEIPAMAVTDAVTRLIPSVLKKEATILESFTENLLEQPQYTKPEIYKDKRVPKILLSGHHEKILEWKKEEALNYTKKIRPDLLKRTGSSRT